MDEYQGVLFSENGDLLIFNFRRIIMQILWIMKTILIN